MYGLLRNLRCILNHPWPQKRSIGKIHESYSLSSSKYKKTDHQRNKYFRYHTFVPALLHHDQTILVTLFDPCKKDKHPMILQNTQHGTHRYETQMNSFYPTLPKIVKITRLAFKVIIQPSLIKKSSLLLFSLT